MRIVSCYTDISEIGPLMAAGADELYTSVRGLPSFIEDYLRGGNAALKKAFRRIHASGGKALVALNAMSVALTADGMRRLALTASRLESEGADAFIVSNPSMLDLLRNGPRPVKAALHLSSVQPCFNSGTLKFFLRFGINRLILPSQLAPLEAAGLLRLCRSEGVETEIFDYRFFGCVYVNGRCGLHKPNFYDPEGTEAAEGSLCRCGAASDSPAARPLGTDARRAAEAPALARRLALRMGCGGAPRFYNAASFYDFFRLGVGWLKYGVRSDPPAVKARKVRELRAMADLAERLSGEMGAADGRTEFIRRMTAWKGE
jgi:hypothetical protein